MNELFSIDEAIYKRILDNLHDGVYFTDHEGVITYWNRGAESITGLKAQDVIGRRCCENIVVHMTAEGKRCCDEGCLTKEIINTGKNLDASLFLHHKEGYLLPVLLCKSPIKDTSGRIMGTVEVFTDNSWKVAAVERIEELKRLALLDALTLTGNRRYGEMHLQARMDEMRRFGLPLAVLMIDIDNFKKINDSHGHNMGDKTIVMVARTLQHALRSYDILSRWGGEEFMVILSNVDQQQMEDVTERLRRLVELSGLRMDEGSIKVTVSIGGTFIKAEDTAEQALKRADQFMYDSKAAGRNKVTLG